MYFWICGSSTVSLKKILGLQIRKLQKRIMSKIPNPQIINFAEGPLTNFRNPPICTFAIFRPYLRTTQLCKQVTILLCMGIGYSWIPLHHTVFTHGKNLNL